MAIYAVGDLQGCLDPLLRLLNKIRFDPSADQLWLVGDLVNRGPQSLEVLRYLRELDKAAVCVLGNHDLHLLALWATGKPPKRSDTLNDVLAAADAHELLEWLRHRPLLHHDATIGWLMVHAGLPPQWDLELAKQCAAEVELALQSPDHKQLFEHMYADSPKRWSPDLKGIERLRFSVNAMTRIRYLTKKGELDFACKTAPDKAPPRLTPWFRFPGRRIMETQIVFGHWSTLGLLRESNVLALDTGCLWGGTLTAARLDTADISVQAVTCPRYKVPGN